MKRTFTMKGAIYESMMDIAHELGVKRVYPRDFDKYGIKEVTDEPTTAPAPENKVETPVDDKAVETKTEDKKPKTKTEKAAKKSGKVKKADEAKKPDETDIVDSWKAAGEVDSSLKLEDFARKLRKVSMDDLTTFAKAKDLNLYEELTNEPIRRMRIIMALKDCYYPDEKLETKKSTGFRKIALDVLVAKAAEKNLEYRNVGNEAIQRMWVTKALIEAGVTPEDVQPEETPKPTKKSKKTKGAGDVK